MKKQILLLLALNFFNFPSAQAQGSPDYSGGYKIEFDEDGTKYLRIIAFTQMQVNYSDDVPSDESQVNFNLKRARVIMFAQINKKFMAFTHFGLNNLNDSTLSPTGKGNGSQLFMHGVWNTYNVTKEHYLGGGLHYYNGISRLNSQATLNFLTLDNNRQSWATLGLSDQFARHLGFFAKGKFGKLDYRASVNDAITDGLDSRTPTLGGGAVYAGKRLRGSRDAGKTFAGYFDYQFLDQESNLLPYRVGSYLGGKKVFNIGAGFFLHPKGSVILNSDGNLKGEDVSIYALDVFYDTPIGNNGSALTAYAVVQSNDYGKDYLFSAYGTGSMLYSHVGYVLPGDKTKTRYQPFISYGINSFDAVNNNRTTLKVGVNAYMSGHNSKFTLEYKNERLGGSTVEDVTFQMSIFL